VNEEKSVRYHRLRRRAALTGTALTALGLILFLASGWSVMVREWAGSASGGSHPLTVLIYVGVVSACAELVHLPVAFYEGVILERRYGLSVQPTVRWWLDWAKGSALSLAFGEAGALIVTALLRAAPARWWLLATACFGVLLVVLAQLAPVLLLPLFYTFTPLRRPELTDRLTALAERCGARVLGVFEWRLGDKTRKANAALAGIGHTRRILLSDTVLADYSDDEIEVIVAHELGHHAHHDIWKSITIQIALLALGFYAADRALAVFVGPLGLGGPGDVAALPLLVLSLGAVSLVLLPVANALSRAHERRADRFALDVTGKSAAFMSAMRRLATQNLAEERPSRLVEVLFHSHPSIAARLDAARAWESRRA
jgi:STE24 endopeptidase